MRCESMCNLYEHWLYWEAIEAIRMHCNLFMFFLECLGTQTYLKTSSLMCTGLDSSDSLWYIWHTCELFEDTCLLHSSSNKVSSRITYCDASEECSLGLGLKIYVRICCAIVKS